MEDFVEARVGQTIGQRWTLRRVLGVGGMAAVYEATDDSGSEVAVKIPHPEFGGALPDPESASYARVTSRTASSMRARCACSSTGSWTIATCSW